MKEKHSIFLTAIALCSASSLLTGCVTHTTIKDEPRRSIGFASVKAAQTFYDAYLQIHRPAPGKNSICLYLPMPYLHYTTQTENVRFNQAIKAADTNKDGIISEGEAEAYKGKLKKPAS